MSAKPIAIASDHAGFDLKAILKKEMEKIDTLTEAGLNELYALVDKYKAELEQEISWGVQESFFGES